MYKREIKMEKLENFEIDQLPGFAVKGIIKDCIETDFEDEGNEKNQDILHSDNDYDIKQPSLF